jgi:hypothetical protein
VEIFLNPGRSYNGRAKLYCIDERNTYRLIVSSESARSVSSHTPVSEFQHKGFTYVQNVIGQLHERKVARSIWIKYRLGFRCTDTGQQMKTGTKSFQRSSKEDLGTPYVQCDVMQSLKCDMFVQILYNFYNILLNLLYRYLKIALPIF